jgi:hypothetical protein
VQPVHSIRGSLSTSATGLVGVFLALSAAPTWARTVRVRCADGAASALVSQAGSARRSARVCDLDQTCDGACTFGFCGVAEFRCAHDPRCVASASGVCEPCACPPDTVVVPAGRQRRFRDASGATLILRCRSRCAGCERDADCDDGNGCSLDRCADGACTHECLCVAPGEVPTCCPGPVVDCPTRTPCGPSASCDRTSEICVSRGPFGPAVTYACEPVPPGCELDRSCACAAASVCEPPFDTCRDTAPNELFCECVECQ